MNKACRAEIQRLQQRTHPAVPDSPFMVLAKWCYVDAANIAKAAGNEGIANAILERVKFKKDE